MVVYLEHVQFEDSLVWQMKPERKHICGWKKSRAHFPTQCNKSRSAGPRLPSTSLHYLTYWWLHCGGGGKPGRETLKKGLGVGTGKRTIQNHARLRAWSYNFSLRSILKGQHKSFDSDMCQLLVQNRLVIRKPPRVTKCFSTMLTIPTVSQNRVCQLTEILLSRMGGVGSAMWNFWKHLTNNG